MEYFAHLVANKASNSKMINIRKVYLNEDPNTEQTEPCPKCVARNQPSTVRYMFVNLQEAIYKCDSPYCMYPFQNFKFKNYTDNTVYYYTAAVEETPPALEDFGTTFTNVFSPLKVAHHEHHLAKVTSPSSEFHLQFLSPERKATVAAKPGVSPGVNIFDSPSLSYKNLVQDFDTGFIDDILQDLGQPSSPEKKPVLVSPVRVVVKKDPSTRQLKRCLQMFKDSSSESTVFKVPPLPGSEVPSSSPKIKSKKHSPLRRHKYVRRTHHHHHQHSNGSSSSSSSSSSMSRKSRMKPLDFIESVKSIQPKEAPPAEPKLAGVKPLSNQKVERMLNFIERSMKKRESTPDPPISPVPPVVEYPPKHSFEEQPVKALRAFRKTKRLSLSAAVLEDSQFDYSTSESEHDDTPPDFAAPPPSAASTESVNSEEPFRTPPPENDPSAKKHTLPSFEDLLQHIHHHPVAHNIPPEVGFRSAGSSPTRVQPWEKTPPRRIHSMESLSSLLE